MAVSLRCFGELENLANNKSREMQSQFLMRVLDLFFMTEKMQGTEDNDLFGHVMMQAIGNVDRQTRTILAQRLSKSSKAPLSIINHLACDHIKVAEPVLLHAKKISDRVLLNVIDNKILEHIHVICRRKGLSQTVSDFLLQNCTSKTLLALAQNKQADISPTGFDILIDLAVSDEKIRQALLRRDDKPEDCLDQIKESLSFSIKCQLLKKHKNLSNERAEEMAFTRAENILQSDQMDFIQTGARLSIQQIDELNEEGNLNQYIVADLARNQQKKETLHALSLLSGLDKIVIDHLVMTAEISALSVFCKNMFFSRDSFLAVLEFKAMRRRMSAKAITTTLHRYDELTYENAVQIMAYLKERFKVLVA